MEAGAGMADYSEFIERVTIATSAFDKSAAETACGELIERIRRDAAAAPAPQIRKVLSALRNKRYVDVMERVADAAILSGQTDPQIRRLYAQALIDQGRLTAALNVLQVLALETSDSGELRNRSENAEARGLIGRAHKQAYVNATSQTAYLNRAIKAYFEVYDSDRDQYLWHGINAVACLCRAERDGRAPAGYQDPRVIATEILEKIEAITPRDRVGTWDRATAIEACLSLNRVSDAQKWLSLYVADPLADAFALGSTLRQLKELWQLVPGAEPGSSVLPILESALLQREGGRVDLSPGWQSGVEMTRKAAIALEAGTSAIPVLFPSDGTGPGFNAAPRWH